MVFQSTDYFVFLLAVFAGYWFAPREIQRLMVFGLAGLMAWTGHTVEAGVVAVVAVAEWKFPMAQPGNLLLLVFSYLFYAYIHPWYALLIALTTCIDWYSALALTRNPGKAKRYLILSLATNFTILAVFKYCGFFVDNIIAAAGAVGLNMDHPHWKILLPVGISFYTFQSASYVVDVFRKQTAPRHNFLDYTLFVSFFPQLVAGPIERAGHLLAQLEGKRTLDWVAVRSGLLLILWGLFQKRVIADNSALLVNKVFALEQNSFPILWAGVLAFGVQIYADFSAYTNMARGSARMLGIEICQNFNHPYLASNPADFWRRWHISLSTWFRDYVYIPLGGNRGGDARVVRNILITFGLSGLWHGANWNFILWGLFHGSLVAIWHLLDTHCPRITRDGGKLSHVAKVIVTFILVHIAWLMFREQNLGQLWRALTLNPWNASVWSWETGWFIAMQAVIYALPLWVLPILESACGKDWCRLPAPQSWTRTLLEGVVAAILLAGVLVFASQVGSDFIYFQF